MAYRAEIEIGVRGQDRLNKLQNQISRLAEQITRVNDQSIFDVVEPKAVQSVQNYSNALSVAAANLREVALGQKEETTAIREYVDILIDSSAAQKRQNNLINEEIARRTAVTSAIREQVEANVALSRASREASGFSDKDPVGKSIRRRLRKLAGNPFAYASPIGPVESPLQGQSSPVEERIRRTVQGKKEQLELDQALFELERKSAERLNDKVRLQSDLVEGTREVYELIAREKRRVVYEQQFTAYDRPAAPGGEPFAEERASARQTEAAVRNIVDLQNKAARAAGSWQEALRTGTRWLQEGLELNASMLTVTNNILSSTYAQEAARKRMTKIKAFELEQEQKIAAVRKRTESISLGVGFPLLFGGGVGSVAGSFAGSFLGESGFGGQILLGAIGQKAEEFVRAAAAVTESTESISEALKLTGTSSEAYIQALERAGRESEAYTYALNRLALVVGSDGVEAFKQLQDAGETFNRAFAEITTSILALAARLLAGAAQGIAGAVEETALFRRAAVSEDPQTKQLIAQLQSPATGFQSFLTGGRAYDDLLKQIIERQRELKAEQQKSAASVTSIVNTHREDLAVLTKRLELTQLNGDITDASVIAATKELYVLERQAEQQKLYNNYATDAITIDVLRAGIKKSQLDYETKLAELVNDVNKARTTGADKAQKAAEAASDLTQKLQRELELATAKTKQDQEALKILFEYEDNVKAIRKLEDQSQSARQLKIADELYSLQLNRLATDELTKYLDTLISIAAVDPGLGRQAFQGSALQGALQTDVALAFGTQANLAEATPEDIQLQKAKDQLEDLIAPINMVQTAARGIGSAFTDSFKSVIDGTATTQEALANMFSRIADAFFDMAAQIITQLLVIKAIESAISIFGGTSSFKGFSGGGPVAFPSDLSTGVAGFKANGGPVSAGSPYVVGEKGPELFVPGRSGTIVPNNQLGSGGATSVTVNVDAKGSNVEGNDQGANQLGKAIGLAVQQELIKQKRPGGLLAGV